MRTRRSTISINNSRSFLSDNESLDTFAESSRAEPLAANTSSTTSSITTTTMTTTGAIQNEINRYHNLATKFFIDRQFTIPMEFWKAHCIELPLLSRMARCYLSSPATSVKSESAFSIWAHHVRKERSRLTPEHLAISVFLKDKL